MKDEILEIFQSCQATYLFREGYGVGSVTKFYEDQAAERIAQLICDREVVTYSLHTKYTEDQIRLIMGAAGQFTFEQIERSLKKLEV